MAGSTQQKTLLFSQSGMSLLSVIMAAGLLGLIALAAAKLQQNMMMGQKDVENRFDINKLHSNIRGVLGNKDACIQTLGINSTDINGHPIFLSLYSNSPPSPIGSIKDPSGNKVYEVGRTYGDVKIAKIEFSTFTRDPGPNRKITIPPAIPGDPPTNYWVGDGSTKMILFLKELGKIVKVLLLLKQERLN